MDTKLSSKISYRYKSLDERFSSMEESRTLRAIGNKKLQKNKREKTLTRLRQISSTPLESKHSLKPEKHERSTKKYSKDELKELAKVRYTNMLKWKDEKHTELVRERRNRRPSFHTGLYAPDNPKFLSGADGDTLDSFTFKATPWKGKGSAVKTPSTTKRILRSSASNKGFRTARPLKFHSGATPNPRTSIIGNASITKQGTKLRRGKAGSIRAVPELGVRPLPVTPSFGPKNPQRGTSQRKKVRSFAPQNFEFQVPDGLESYNLKERLDALLSDFPSESTSSKASVVNKDAETSPSTLVITETADVLKDNKYEVSSDQKQQEKNKLSPEKTNALTSEAPASSSKCLTEDFHLILSDEDKEVDSEEAHNFTLNAGATPGPACATRGKKNEMVTPPLAKLRPRTPCSRSTRRSKLAHYDHSVWDIGQLLLTPAPRKRTKKSVSICIEPENIMGRNTDCDSESTKSLNDDITENKEDLSKDNPDIPEETSPLETPDTSHLTSIRQKEEVFSEFPWITKSRGSSSMKRNLKKTGTLMNELELMFNDVPFTEPVSQTVSHSSGASPQLKTRRSASLCDKVSAQKEAPVVGLPSYYAEEIKQAKELPAINVWSPESAVLESCDSAISSAVNNTSMGKEIADCSTDLISALKPTKGRRSRRSRVSVKMPEPLNSDAPCCHSIFNSPSSNNSRISLGIFAKDPEANSPIKSSVLQENVLRLDSPLIPLPNRRRTKRMSHVPSLKTLEENREQISASDNAEQDMISWEIPLVQSSMGNAGATPSRRSVRLSKVPILYGI